MININSRIIYIAKLIKAEKPLWWKAGQKDSISKAGQFGAMLEIKIMDVITIYFN